MRYYITLLMSHNSIIHTIPCLITNDILLSLFTFIWTGIDIYLIITVSNKFIN